MSDGPHKCLPMPRRWREFAERAANPACTMKEVTEALAPALKRDFAETPMEAVRDILGGDAQTCLFPGDPNDRIAQLDALRDTCRGSSVANALIDCAIEAVASKLIGEAAISSALEHAVEAYARHCFRSVEECYQREGTDREANFIRGRLQATRSECDYKTLAADLKSGEKPSAKSLRVQKRSGVDEGPQL